MKLLRMLRALLAVFSFAATALAADAIGTWKWKITAANGELETTLKVAMKDGKLAGIYQNQFGETPVKDLTFKDDVLGFAVDREFGGNKFTIKLSGKVEGDTIKGEIELPNFGGDGGTQKMPWNAKRVTEGGSPGKK